MKKELSEIEREMSSPDFWNDTQKAQKLSQERNRIEAQLNAFSSVEQKLEDSEVLIEMQRKRGMRISSKRQKTTLGRLRKSSTNLKSRKFYQGNTTKTTQ